MHNLQSEMPINDHKNQNYPNIQNMTDQYGSNNHTILGNDNIGTSNLNNLSDCFNQNPTPIKNYNHQQSNMFNMFQHSQNHNNPSPNSQNRNQQSPYPNSVNDAINVTNFYGKLNQGDTSSENDTKSEDIRGSLSINKFKDQTFSNHTHRQMYSSEDNIQNQANSLNDFKTKTNQMSKSISNVTTKQDSLNFKFSNNPYQYLNANQTGRTSAPPITNSNETKSTTTVRPRPNSKLLGRPVNGPQRINRRYQNNQDDQHWYSLIIQGKVKNLSSKLWSFTHMTKLDMKDNNIRVLPDEISKLKHLFILDVSGNSIRTLPSTLGDLLELRELNVSNNKIKTLPPALGRLFNLKSLSIEGNEVDSRIMDLRNSNIDNPTQVLLSELFEQYYQQNQLRLSEEPTREWVCLPMEPNYNRADPITLTVMTYNILCDKLATRIQFPYCPPWALNWANRSRQMLKEIQHYSPDIVCLQELEKRAYKNQFLHFLSTGQEKYESCYSQKSRVHNMGFEQKEYVDGCAIFYKSDLLKPLLEYTVDFNSLACKVVEGCEYRDQLVNRMSSKDNIGLITLFEWYPIADTIPYYIVIVNAHLHWDPEFSDIKILQTILLTNAIHKVRVAATSEIIEKNEDGTSVHVEPELNEEENSEFKPKNRDEDLDTDKIKMKHTHQSKILIGRKPESIPVIIAGDFNSTPTSAVTDYMVEGKVDLSHVEFNNYSFPKHFNKLTQNKYERINRINAEKNLKKKKRSEKFLGDVNNNSEENLDNCLMHPLNLKSAYDLNCLETPFTNYTYEFVDMIDYIFYTQDNLTCAGRLKGINRDWFEQRKIPGCPFVGVPSDHLCLLAEFRVKNTRNNKEMMSRSDTINTNVLSNMTDHHSNDQNLINTNNMHNGTNSPHHGSLTALNNINFRDLLLNQSNSHGSAVLNGNHGNPASPRLPRLPNNYLSNNDNFMASNSKNRHQAYNRW